MSPRAQIGVPIVELIVTVLLVGHAHAGGGSCCSPNGTPGCQTLACEVLVCSFDPFCCDVEWDTCCANDADLICAICGSSCGESGAGDCCNDNGTPGCDDPDCCGLVCVQFTFCCEVQWDSSCAQVAASQCAGCAATTACCFEDGSCMDLTDIECGAAGGESQPAGICSQVNCPEPEGSACCFDSGACSDDLEGFECIFAGGTPNNEGPCSEVDCTPVDPAGACCLLDGSCMTTFQSFCFANPNAHAFHAFQACIAVDCHPIAACCLDDGSCTLATEPDCRAMSGEYQGVFVGCEQAGCVPTLGACCIGGRCFDFFTEPNCIQLDGVYLGDESSCDEQACSSPCPTDIDGDGQTGVDDLVAVILAWGPGDGPADLDHNGIVDVLDLVQVVVNWGPCP